LAHNSRLSPVHVSGLSSSKNNVAFEGDLFESESDIGNPTCWSCVSRQPQLLATSRYDIVTQFPVRFIIPGHGAMFQLTEDHVKLLSSQRNSIYDVSEIAWVP